MGVGLNESDKKGKFMTKIFFQIMLNKLLKCCKNISADVKVEVKQQEIKELVAVNYSFLQEVSSKLEIQYKKGVFNLTLLGISTSLILPFKKRG